MSSKHPNITRTLAELEEKAAKANAYQKILDAFVKVEFAPYNTARIHEIIALHEAAEKQKQRRAIQGQTTASNSQN